MIRGLVPFFNERDNSLFKNLLKIERGLFDDFFGDSKSLENFGSAKLDIQEKKDSYLINVDVPGMSKEKIDVNISNGILTISGERKEEKTEGDEESSTYHKERFFGSFQRSISLPDGIDEEKVSATYKDGVLGIEIKKSPKAIEKNRKVKID